MKRLIIRSFFIMLLLLGVGGWGWSYFYTVDLSYSASTGRLHTQFGTITVEGEISGGKLILVCFDNPWYWRGWSFSQNRRRSKNDLETYVEQWNDWQLLGFRFYIDGTYHLRFIQIPLWFPSIVFSIGYWLVWRKTRPKPIGRAFPVELAKESKTP